MARQFEAGFLGERSQKSAFGPGIDWNEFVIVTAKDIPGKNCIALIEDDQPCLADGMVNHPEEPILLLAHPDRHVLPKAVDAVVDRIRSTSSESSRWKKVRNAPKSFGV